MENNIAAIFKKLDAIFCDPEGRPCFSGSEGDRNEYSVIRKAALSAEKNYVGEDEFNMEEALNKSEWAKD